MPPLTSNRANLRDEHDTENQWVFAHAGTSFAAGDIASDGALRVEAGNNITTGAVETFDALQFVAGNFAQASNGSILTGDVAATGAIVGEFVGANAGLGYLLLRGTSYLDMPLIFAVLVALSVVGILFSYAVQTLEVLLMPWQRKS